MARKETTDRVSPRAIGLSSSEWNRFLRHAEGYKTNRAALIALLDMADAHKHGASRDARDRAREALVALNACVDQLSIERRQAQQALADMQEAKHAPRQ